MKTEPISDETDILTLQKKEVNYTTLEKLLKYEELLTKFKTIDPNEPWETYPLKKNNISFEFRINHDTKRMKGLFEKLKPNYFICPEDYEIKNIKISNTYSKNYLETHEIIFNSCEFNRILTETEIKNTPHYYFNDFIKEIPINKNTTIKDVKNGLDGFITLTTFVNTCIDEIEKPARDIIQNNYEKLLTKKT